MQLPVLLRKRQCDSHKADYGHVLVIGGSIGMTGAVCLCAQAVLRSGAGVVTVAIPKSLNPIFETKLTEAMSYPVAEKPKGYLAASAFAALQTYKQRTEVIALGCGAGQKSSTQRLLRRVVQEIDKPLVVDADGLNALAGNLKTLSNRQTKHLIITPHLGEFSRLLKCSVDHIKKARKELAKEFALRYNLTIVLKGPNSIVTNGEQIFENTTGNPGMATAGSGDVLTGIISGLLAQGVETYEAACAGVYIHGLAGDRAAQDKTQTSLIASDIIDYMPEAIRVMSSEL